MARNIRRKIKSSRKQNITLKTRSARRKRNAAIFGRSNNPFEDFLEKQISVKSLFKYIGIALAVLLILIIVFSLGKYSNMEDKENNKKTTEDSRVLKSSSSDIELENEELIVETEETFIENETEEVYSDTVEEYTPSEEIIKEELVIEEYVYETEQVEFEQVGEKIEDPACKATLAEFDYEYKNVKIEVSNYQTTQKDDNWATIDAIKIKITNEEKCTIINPTQIKMKLNNRGKAATWWDDEVYLPNNFHTLKPGESTEELIPVHVSYADIHLEKYFKLVALDEYGLEMGIYSEYMTLE